MRVRLAAPANERAIDRAQARARPCAARARECATRRRTALGAGQIAIRPPPNTISAADPDPHHQRRDDEVELRRRRVLQVGARPSDADRDDRLFGRQRTVAEGHDPAAASGASMFGAIAVQTSRVTPASMLTWLTGWPADQASDRSLTGFAQLRRSPRWVRAWRRDAHAWRRASTAPRLSVEPVCAPRRTSA